jgi:hypothetical protein
MNLLFHILEETDAWPKEEDVMTVLLSSLQEASEWKHKAEVTTFRTPVLMVHPGNCALHGIWTVHKNCRENYHIYKILKD